MTIKIEKFLGYSSKSDKFTGSSRIASDCENIIINQGDICNIPYAQSILDHREKEVEHRYLFYNIRDFTYRIRFSPDESLSRESSITISRFSSSNFSTGGIVFSNASINYDRLDLGTGGAGYKNTFTHGNLYTIGEWAFFLTPGHKIDVKEFPGFDNLGQMVRFKVAENILLLAFPGDPLPTLVNAIHSPIGIPAPKKIAYNSVFKVSAFTGDNTITWGTSIQGDIGLTFITDLVAGGTRFDPQASNVNSSIKSLNDIESNITVEDTLRTLTSVIGNDGPQFKVYVPDGYSQTLLSVRHKCGIYFRRADEAFYYFVGYSPEVGAITNDGDGEGDYVLVNLWVNSPVTGNRDLNITAPLSGVSGPTIGSHNVPRAAVHGAFYLRRMYYQSLSAEFIGREISGNIRNRLEVSMITPDGEDETGRYAVYIEEEQFIGNAAEQGSGLVVFLGQLVIFTENSTYVLNDDIFTGSIKVLFKKKGCVNTRGGKAYIVINNILYWLSDDGFYMFTGASNQPVKVSIPIEPELNAINRKRYSFARVTADTRYGLIYLSFPKIAEDTSEIPTFIFHYEEQGVWTKIVEDAPSEVLRDKDDNVYFNKRSQFEKLGLLEDDAKFIGIGLPRWESNFLEMSDPKLRKLWQSIRIIDEIKVAFPWDIQVYNGELLLDEKYNSEFLTLEIQEDKIRFVLQGRIPSTFVEGAGRLLQTARRLPFPHFRVRKIELEAFILGRI